MGRATTYAGQMTLLSLDELADNFVGQFSLPAPVIVAPKRKRKGRQVKFGPRIPVGVDPDEPQKTCTKCRKPQGVSCFPKDRSRPDGLHARCRDCHRRQSDEQRMGNGVNIGLELLRWYNDNPYPEIDPSDVYVPQYLRPRDCWQCQESFIPGEPNSSRKVLCSPACMKKWIGQGVREAFDAKFEERMAKGMKVCGKCGQDKKFAEFSNDKSKRDGHSNTCRLCMSRRHFTPSLKACSRCGKHIESSLRRRTKATMCHGCKDELGLIIRDEDKGPEPNRKRRYKIDPKYLEERTCAASGCVNTFLVNIRRVDSRLTCSDECRYKLASQSHIKRTPRYELECPQCHNIFWVTRAQLAYRRFCSHPCTVAWTQEYGIPREADLSLRRSKAYSRGPSWNKARKTALERDNHQCQECGRTKEDTGRSVHVHHIVPFRMFGLMRHKEGNDLSNLVTLCHFCHIRTELQNGNKYGQWESRSRKKKAVTHYA